MASTVATATTSSFLVTAPVRTPPQPEPRAEVAQPAPNTVLTWDSSLLAATEALRHATNGGDVAVVQSTRGAVQASLAGALAALNERLLATEDGAAASTLLSRVSNAYDALAATSGTTLDRRTLQNALTDFKARVAESERCWTKQGKSTRYRAAFDALAAELSEHPKLAQMVSSLSASAWKTPGWGGSLTEYRRASDRIQSELQRSFAASGAPPTPLLSPPSGSLVPTGPVTADVQANRRLLEEAGIFWQEVSEDFRTSIEDAEKLRDSEDKGKAYRKAYKLLREDLAPLKTFSGALKRRCDKAEAATSWKAEIEVIEQLTPRVLAELERQLGGSASAQLLPLLPPSAGTES